MPTLPNLTTIGAVRRFSCIFPCLLLLTLCPAASQAEEAKKAALPTEACDFVVSEANQGNLQRILIATDPPGAIEPTGLEGIVFRKRLDINNDGVPERVFVKKMPQIKGKEFFEVYDLQQDRELRIGLSKDDSRLQILFMKAMSLALFEFAGRSHNLRQSRRLDNM